MISTGHFPKLEILLCLGSQLLIGDALYVLIGDLANAEAHLFEVRVVEDVSMMVARMQRSVMDIL